MARELTQGFRAWLIESRLSRVAALFGALLLLWHCPVLGQPVESAAGNPPVRPSMIWSHTAVLPGETITLGVRFDMDEHFHINPRRPDLDFLVPTHVQMRQLPDGVHAEPPRWPAPILVTVNYIGQEERVPVYRGGALVRIPLRVGSSVTPGEYPVRISAEWQACDDRVCFPPEDQELTATLVVTGDMAAVADSEHAALFAVETEPVRLRLDLAFFGADFSIDPRMMWLLLLLATLGGALLNLTPCVLPLIPIKIMGLSRVGGSRVRTFLLGTAMALGVVTFWLALGGSIAMSAALVARGGEGWISSTNELFQYPAFTITVGIVIAVMAIGMCGLFSLRLPAWIYRFNPSHDTLHGSFLFGVMAAVLSTPCTAPFMGAVAAWAVAQSPLLTLLTFSSIGLGMAAPYLVLTANPKWIGFLPRGLEAHEPAMWGADAS
jgi:thiol:disulfide interchange protein